MGEAGKLPSTTVIRLSFLGLGLIFVIVGAFTKSPWPLCLAIGAPVASLFPASRGEGSGVRLVLLTLALILVTSALFSEQSFYLITAGALLGLFSVIWGRLAEHRRVFGFLLSPLIPAFAAVIWMPSQPFASLFIGLLVSYFFMIFLGLPCAAVLNWAKAKAWLVYGVFGLLMGSVGGFLGRFSPKTSNDPLVKPLNLNVGATAWGRNQGQGAE